MKNKNRVPDSGADDAPEEGMGISNAAVIPLGKPAFTKAHFQG
jgi:hypothetical protein